MSNLFRGIASSRSATVGGLIALAGAAALLGGCSEPPPPPPPPPAAPPPPPPPAIPDEVDGEAVLREVGADPRVRFETVGAVYDRALAEAAVRLANAFATGDDAAARELLDATAQRSLDRLVNTGAWYDATGDALEAVSIIDIEQFPLQDENATEGGVALALGNAEGAEVLGFLGSRESGSWTFAQLQTTPRVEPTVADWKGTRLSEVRGDANLDMNRDLLAYYLVEIAEAALGGTGLEAPPEGVDAAAASVLGPFRSVWRSPGVAARDGGVGQFQRAPSDRQQGGSSSSSSATPGEAGGATTGATAWTIVAAILGISESEVREMYDRGKRDFEAGVKPTPMLVHRTVELTTTAAQSYGFTAPEDAILNTIADIGGLPLAEVRLLNEQGASATESI